MEINKLVLGRIENNTYFVTKGNRCIVIDPSMEYKQIINYIKTHDLCVEAILITHAHFDHVYSLYELKEDTGAKVYMHKDDMPLYKGSVDKLRTKAVEIDVWLSGGETLNILDEDIEVIHNPGHAKGCVSYIINDNMFVGDFIFKGSIGRTDLVTSDVNEMEESLKSFVKLDRDLKIFSGHGEETDYYTELRTNPYLIRLQ